MPPIGAGIPNDGTPVSVPAARASATERDGESANCQNPAGESARTASA